MVPPSIFYRLLALLSYLDSILSVITMLYYGDYVLLCECMMILCISVNMKGRLLTDRLAVVRRRRGDKVRNVNGRKTHEKARKKWI